jgi:hypothetical protein
MPEPKVLRFAVQAEFAETTRLLGDEEELRKMIQTHLNTLLSIFTSGPKPLVKVSPLTDDERLKKNLSEGRADFVDLIEALRMLYAEWRQLKAREEGLEAIRLPDLEALLEKLQ